VLGIKKRQIVRNREESHREMQNIKKRVITKNRTIKKEWKGEEKDRNEKKENMNKR
jgi:hypothetical protein